MSSEKPLREWAADALRQALRRMAVSRRSFWEIPEVRGDVDAQWSRHFHRMPELFFQISGISEMRFPRQTLALHPGCFLLVPPGIPHEEHIVRRGGVFRNLVFMYSGRHAYVHAGRQVGGKETPRGGRSEILVCDPPEAPARYLNDMVMFSNHRTEHADMAIRGLFMAHVACLMRGLENPAPPATVHSTVVWHCRRFIQQRLANPQLNVKTLSTWISCSPDYLSHCFRRATGQRLSRYILEQRIQQAQAMLSDSTLNISEIAYACGFQDPGHFSRVFKQISSETPRAWRRRVLGMSVPNTSGRHA